MCFHRSHLRVCHIHTFEDRLGVIARTFTKNAVCVHAPITCFETFQRPVHDSIKQQSTHIHPIAVLS